MSTTYDFAEGGMGFIYNSDHEVSATCLNRYDHHDYDGDVVIPEYVYHDEAIYTVIGIDDNMFWSCPYLTSISIPATVTSIHRFVADCPLLTKVTCLSVTPPAMPENAFEAEVYASATLWVPKHSVEAYRADASWGQFANIMARDYDLDGGFLCYEITGENEVQVTYRSTDYGNYYGDPSIPATVTVAGVTYNVTAIGPRAFYNCGSVESVSLPTSVKKIGEYAFYNCTGLTSVSLTDVDTIGAYAFAQCTGITSALLNRYLKSIEGTSFLECSSLTKFMMPSGTGVAGSYYINNGVLMKRLPQTLVIYPGGKTNTSYTIPDGTVAVGPYAFAGSKVKTVVMPSTLTSIESRAFANCDLIQTIEIIKGVTSIGDYAFAGCDALTQVILPSTLTTLGAGAFHADEALSVVGTKDKTPASCETIIVDPRTGETLTSFDTDHFSTVTLLVPTGCRATYKAAPVWKLFSTVYESSSMDEEEDVLLGDVDGDGQVNISDVTTLIDHLLGAASDINTDNADVNEDGSIDITDVTVLIDYLLNGSWN